MAVDAAEILTPTIVNSLPSGWSWKRLDSVCEGVFDCPHSTPLLTQEGPLIARSQDMRSGVFRTDEAGHVSEDTFRERIVRAEPKYGDLLYSREGTYFGIAAEVPRGNRVCLGQRMVLLRPNSNKVDFRFLRYWLSAPVMTSYVHGFRDGTVAERLNLPTIRALPVLLPSLTEQHAIAHILGTLDDKIELNRRMNETLEAMARAIFKSWFVDFDPVRAKAEDRDPALPKHIADLFPDSLEDSELGEIPAGWEVGTIGGFASLSRNGINPGDFPDETFEHFSIPAFDEGQTPKCELGDTIKSNKYLIPPDAVLLSKLNPRIPRLWLPVIRDNPRAVCSTEFLVVSPRVEASREYIYGFLSSEAFTDVFETLVTGTSGSHQRVKPEGLLSMNVVIPSKSVIQHFSEVVQPLLARADRAREQSETLAAVRDTLLPKLISGALRVKDTARLIGKAS
jgi:type I restriction enzyme S subunit